MEIPRRRQILKAELPKFRRFLRSARSGVIASLASHIRVLDRSTFVSRVLTDIVKSLVAESAVELFRVAGAAAEKLFGVDAAAAATGDCNLEKMYNHKSQYGSEVTKTVILHVPEEQQVERNSTHKREWGFVQFSQLIQVGIYEAICMFAERQGVDTPMIFNTDAHQKEHFW